MWNCEILDFFEKETLSQVFSYETCDIFEDIFYIEHLRSTASVEICLMQERTQETQKTPRKSSERPMHFQFTRTY